MTPSQPYETLDPHDWEAMRALAHQMVDDAVDYMATLRERPIWQAPPEDVRARFDTPAPRDPSPPEAVYQEFKRDIQPYPMGTGHPRFWGWYMGNGTLFAALGDFLAAVMNSNLGGGNHGANYVEGQVVNWLKTMLGFPPEASGLLVSGGSMANFVGLAVGRHARAGYDVRAEGVAAAPRPFTVYTSVEVHNSVQKAVELLGLGSRQLRKVAVNDDYTIDIAALARTIAADRDAGFQPLAVVGNAGTINTGAVDDFHALADLCTREGLWLHADGAIGAVAVLADTVRPSLAGLERADSIALDLHKWLHIPFEAGCILVRHEEAHHHTFTLSADYLEHGTRGVAAGRRWFTDYGLQLTRQFRALKVWLSIKEHGLDRLGRMMDRNVRQAHDLANAIKAAGDLELMAPVGLDIVCFRYNPGGMGDETLNTVNRDILVELHERAIAVPTYTTLHGRYCLRVAIANHRSVDEDFEALITAVRALGRELAPDA